MVNATATTFNSSTTTMGALNSFNLTLVPGRNGTYTLSTFIMEFTPDFIGIPTCYCNFFDFITDRLYYKL
jgi:hypothetical protein